MRITQCRAPLIMLIEWSATNLCNRRWCHCHCLLTPYFFPRSRNWRHSRTNCRLYLRLLLAVAAKKLPGVYVLSGTRSRHLMYDLHIRTWRISEGQQFRKLLEEITKKVPRFFRLKGTSFDSPLSQPLQRRGTQLRRSLWYKNSLLSFNYPSR